MQLNPVVDYGFTQLKVTDTANLPKWDIFRFDKIREIFQTCMYIVDFGDSSRGLSHLFANELRDKNRITIDLNETCRPDIVADICNLYMLEDDSVDGIICAAVLEHVYNPFIAVSELFRVLKPFGKMFVYVPWIWNYHAPQNGEFADFYRYSKDGIRYLFKNFSHIDVNPVRGRLETILLLTPWFSKKSRLMKIFGNLIRKLDNVDEKFTSGFNIFLIK